MTQDKIGVPCEIWDRTCGYYQNTANYNKGKAAEQRDRKRFSITKALNKEIKKTN